MTTVAARVQSRRRYWLAGLAVLAAITFLLVKGLGSSLVYFKTADEAVGVPRPTRRPDLPH